MEITITRPQNSDLDNLRHLFTETITNAFIEDGIDTSSGSDLSDEIEKQIDFVKQDLESNGQKRYFLLALMGNQIAGIISSANPTTNELIIENMPDIDFSNIPEISSVYVLPEFQSKGVGSILMNSILIYLLSRKVDEVCLDGGYKKSQKYWVKKIGEPNIVLKDYWGPEAHHMIWHRKLKNIPIIFKISNNL